MSNYLGLSENLFRWLAMDSSPLVRRLLKMEMTAISKGSITVRAPYSAAYQGRNLKNVNNGILAALVDHTGGFGAWSLLNNKHKLVSTVDLSVR